MKVYIDSFEAVDDIRRNTPYEVFRDAVIRAGKFSTFEASDTDWKARMYTKLCHDPSVTTDKSVGYPWTLVRAATPEEIEQRQIYAEKVDNAPVICGRCLLEMRNADAKAHYCSGRKRKEAPC